MAKKKPFKIVLIFDRETKCWMIPKQHRKIHGINIIRMFFEKSRKKIRQETIMLNMVYEK